MIIITPPCAPPPSVPQAGPAGDLSRLNVTAAMTLFVLPFVMGKLITLFFFFNVLVEGMKVFVRARQWKWAMEGGLEEGEGLDNLMFFLYLFVFVAPPALYTLVVWLLSGAFVFTLVSTLILAAVSAVSLGLLLLFVDMLRARTVGGEGKVASLIYSMVWWTKWFFTQSDNGASTFNVTIAASFLFFIFGQVAFYGTWLAVVAYGGGGASEFAGAVTTIYQFVFGGLADLSTLAWPTLSLDPTLLAQIPTLVVDYLKGLADTMTALELFTASQALSALANTLLAVVKYLTTLMATAMSALGYFDVAKNAEFNREAAKELAYDSKLQTDAARDSLLPANEQKIKKLEVGSHHPGSVA